MKKKNNKIIFENGKAIFSSGKTTSVESPEHLEKLVFVKAGDIAFANDSACFVFIFKESSWIVPLTTQGWYELLNKHWKDFLYSRPVFFEASLEKLPIKWRRRVLGVFPVPEPEFKQLSPKELHIGWQLVPVSFESWQLPLE